MSAERSLASARKQTSAFTRTEGGQPRPALSRNVEELGKIKMSGVGLGVF